MELLKVDRLKGGLKIKTAERVFTNEQRRLKKAETEEKKRMAKNKRVKKRVENVKKEKTERVKKSKE